MLFTGELSIRADKRDDPAIRLNEICGKSVRIIKILRRSIDARKKSQVIIKYRILIEANAQDELFLSKRGFLKADCNLDPLPNETNIFHKNKIEN